MYVKELPVVYEMLPLEDTLKQMCEARTNSAIFFDEYGGTSGLVHPDVQEAQQKVHLLYADEPFLIIETLF
ncbi:hypothetical protein [Exiguobacterium aurantiacum]|uniref:hypothetical protein n=1 Tax=Exiguobacterium aurantiacum TaxID=33987 RepID=UPI0008779380|nr:hypothetical protein [Exiguobacterium aurantiacum]